MPVHTKGLNKRGLVAGLQVNISVKQERLDMIACACVRERECVCVRESERQGVCVFGSVCVYERDREFVFEGECV